MLFLYYDYDKFYCDKKLPNNERYTVAKVVENVEDHFEESDEDFSR